jgi:hypothetical protein
MRQSGADESPRGGAEAEDQQMVMVKQERYPLESATA